jgi:uncharacterized membrane protein
METWMIYALVATIFIWLNWYFQKILSESKTMNKDSFLFYNYFILGVTSLFITLILGGNIIFTWWNILIALLLTIIFTMVMKTRIESLKYVSTATYFINFRLFSSILLLFFWQLFFWEIITIKEYIWVWLGIIIFYLLFDKKYSSEKKDNFYKWLLYICYWIILVTILQLIVKYFIINWFDIFSILFFEWIFWSILILLTKEVKSNQEVLCVKNKKHLMFYLTNGILFFIGAYFNSIAFEQWDVAIVYKIISYSIFIPIILSVIFYKEKITVKKLLAFILTIASIWLFI